MTTTRNLLAGFGGALAVNLLHEALKKKVKDAPRLDKIGENAVQKATMMTSDKPIENKGKLYATALGADLVANTMYYAMIGAGNPKHIWPKAVGLGVTAGTGAITLPSALGINGIHTDKTAKTKSMTMGYYLFGALVTAGLLKFMDSRNILAT